MGLGAMEIGLILAIVVILFGAKKIPDLAKGMGLGIKNFKKALKEDEQEEAKPIEQNVEQNTVKNATNDK